MPYVFFFFSLSLWERGTWSLFSSGTGYKTPLYLMEHKNEANFWWVPKPAKPGGLPAQAQLNVYELTVPLCSTIRKTEGPGVFLEDWSKYYFNIHTIDR